MRTYNKVTFIKWGGALIILLFWTGACLMSFLMFIIQSSQWRLASLVRRSHCNVCYSKLTWYELMPIISYILLKRRCTHCQSLIPTYLFVAELLGGFIAIYPILFHITMPLKLFYNIAFILLVLSFIDCKILIIPHRWLVILCITAIALHTFQLPDFKQTILTVLLFIFGMIYYRYIGFGDIKLLCIMALILPFPFMICLLIFLCPIALCLLPFLLIFKVIKLPHIPLVPAILLTFIIVSTYYEPFYHYFGGFL